MTTNDIPIIRLDADETASAEDDMNGVAKQLRDACENVGFFYLVGHCIPNELLENVLEQARKLFDLPDEVKLSMRDSVMSRGYTAMEEETLDPANQSRGDTKEGFNIGTDIPIDDPRYDPSKFRGPNQWPTPSQQQTEKSGMMSQEECDTFKKIMESYYDEMCQLGMKVVRRIALSLGLPANHFDRHFQILPVTLLRLLHYAPVQSQPDAGIFACGAHTDYGMITLLLVDDTTPGLQILTKEGQWIDVPKLVTSNNSNNNNNNNNNNNKKEIAFVVNLGDMLERYTNGMYRSTPHRVLTSGDTHRYSIPFFYEPNFDAVVECLDVCCSKDNPPKYPPTTSGLHLLGKYQQTHADFTPSLIEKI